MLDLFGKGAKFAVGGSYTDFSAQGLVEGEPKGRDDQGFTDPGFKLSVNLLGSPALKLSEFKNYHQDLVLGVSLGVTAPWGEYDSDRFLNLGFNRWAVKPGIGVSKMLGRWIVEGSAAVALFGDNTDFNGGQTRKQDPLVSLQVHTIYRIKPGGLWASFDATYYEGGATTVDQLQKDDGLSNYRLGATLALPVNRRNSIKLYASAGTNSRRGSEYDLVGIGWQYRWGDGLRRWRRPGCWRAVPRRSSAPPSSSPCRTWSSAPCSGSGWGLWRRQRTTALTRRSSRF